MALKRHTGMSRHLLGLLAMLVCGIAWAGQAPRYTCERTFTYGLWGSDTAVSDAGWAGVMRNMRRAAMNVLVAPAPEGESIGQRLASLRHLSELAKANGIMLVPQIGSGIDEARRLAEAFRTDPSIVAWYVKDEPDPNFLPTFLEFKKLLAEIAPAQPAVCLFYRPDSATDFARAQPIMLTDCYPLAYTHEGTSLGPHFALRKGQQYFLDKGMGRYLPFGTRGVLEWMDLIRANAGDLPHWATLAVFESGDSRLIRWRQPTAAELRLQVHMAIAGGAKGINFFRYSSLVDDYGNPRASLQGDESLLWDEIVRLGAWLAPLGPVLAGTVPDEPVSVLATWRPTPEPGNRIEVRRLRSTQRDVTYLAAFNNDVLVRSSADVCVTDSYLRGRRVYDLDRLEPAKTERTAGGVSFPVELEAGGGTIFAVASEADYQADRRTILEGRCRRAAGIFEIDRELARKSGVKAAQSEQLRENYEDLFRASRFDEALPAIYRAAAALDASFQADCTFRTVQEDLDWIKRVLPRKGEQQKILAPVYTRLLEQFWAGNARQIAGAAANLREQVRAAE